MREEFRTIYHDGSVKAVDRDAQISIWDSEKRVCQRLMTMGYNHCGPVSLERREATLHRAIERLEMLRRKAKK